MNINIYVGSDSYINSLANEYFKIANDGKNKAREKMLLNQLANEMIYKKNNSFCKKARSIAYNIIQKYDFVECGNTPEELLNICFMKAIKSYDPEKSDNFAQWFLDNILYSAKEIYGKYFTKKKNEDNKKITVPKITPVSNNNDDDDAPDFLDTIPDINSGDTVVFGKIMAEEFLVRIITLLTRFCQNSKHMKKARYFRCFFTDYIAAVCKNEGLHHDISINENDIMKAVDENFLDFTFTDKCRCFDDIELTPLKTYKELGLSDKTESIVLPFELKVFAKYLDVSEAAVSLSKDAFLQLIQIDKRKPSI